MPPILTQTKSQRSQPAERAAPVRRGCPRGIHLKWAPEPMLNCLPILEMAPWRSSTQVRLSTRPCFQLKIFVAFGRPNLQRRKQVAGLSSRASRRTSWCNVKPRHAFAAHRVGSVPPSPSRLRAPACRKRAALSGPRHVSPRSATTWSWPLPPPLQSPRRKISFRA